MRSLAFYHQHTPSVYQDNADAWHQQRPRVFFEKSWLDRFIHALPVSAGGSRQTVVDLGCGTGKPITAYLCAAGLSVTGVDSSERMLEIAHASGVPASWLLMDMREFDMGSSRFDGILSWDGFFHLSPPEQRAAIVRYSEFLKPGGALLLTIGDEAGEITGTVNGQTVYHSSLDIDEYVQLLTDIGFKTIEYRLCDRDCAEHSVVLASQLNRPD